MMKNESFLEGHWIQNNKYKFNTQFDTKMGSLKTKC